MERKLSRLFKNYLDNQSSDEDIIALLEYFKISEQEPLLRELIMHELQRSGTPNIKIEGIDQRLDQAYANVKEYIDQHRVPVVRKVRLWPRIGTVAAAIAIVVSGIYFFNYMDHKPDTGLSVDYAHDIKPGKVGATLTLGSGKKLRLSDLAKGEIAEEAGIKVRKTGEGELIYEFEHEKGVPGMINTLSTAIGETYILILPDKSKVWLNAASSLTYSTDLNDHGLRRVKLEGEAFFQVAKDKAHPFVVQTAEQEIEVLGTQFNVNSYRDEGVIATTLVEGSVKVKDGRLQQIIAPGEQVINDGVDLQVAKVNLDNVLDWKEGEFNLDGLAFPVAMRKIARWYNVEVIYDASVPDNIITGGWISRETKLSTILEVIQRSKQVHFKLKGRKLYVSK